jgi:hypothetical protein
MLRGIAREPRRHLPFGDVLPVRGRTVRTLAQQLSRWRG